MTDDRGNSGVEGSDPGRPQLIDRLRPYTRKPDVVTLLVGLAIGLAVCGPLMGGGRVFFLDWSIGAHFPVVSVGSLGLDGGLTSGVAASYIVAVLNPILGGSVTWIPILLFFPIAVVGAGRLAGGSNWTRVSAGLFYAVNPFVFSRLFVGHIPLLIGYALLPFATIATITSVASRFRRWPVPSLWWAGLTALSPHFAWIFGLIILGVFLFALWKRGVQRRRAACWFGLSVGLFALMSTYILLPHGSTSLPTQVGRVSLDLYRTSGDPHLGLFINVLALYGFWRMGPGPELPKDVISGWPFLMVAILLVIGAGVWLAVRRGTHRPELLAENSSSENGRLKSGVVQFQSRQGKVHESLALSEYKPYLALLLIFIGFVGFFLALGDQGPTGWLFLWAYDHVTFFALMREPQKFVMLLALSYAVFFGWGVGHLAQLKLSFSRIRNLAMVTVVGVALPLGYSANIFDGLSGQIAPSSVPVSYQQADRLMGMGAGTVLYVPWHLYMSYPFTNNRVVANIGASEFRRTVISGDNVESGDVESQSTSPRSTYLQQLFSDGPHLREFGALVAPLGVQYVVLAKTVDWVSYSWLGNQDDLTMILNTSSLEVWRNDDYAGVGWRATKLTPVSGVGGLVILSKIDGLAGRALITKGTVANSLNPDPQHSTQEATGSPPSSPSVIELSPVAYRISSGTSSWVTVDVPYQRGWSLDGRAATESAEGTLLIHVGPRGGELQFTPWSLVRLGYILSTSTFLVLLGIVLCGGQVDRRRRASAGEKSKFRGK